MKKPTEAGTMVRASYKNNKGQEYQLYGVPGAGQNREGVIFMQTQQGFKQNLPPLRLSATERDALLSDFSELQEQRRSTANYDFFQFDERVGVK